MTLFDQLRQTMRRQNMLSEAAKIMREQRRALQTNAARKDSKNGYR